MPDIRVSARSLGYVFAFSLIAATGCNDKSAPSSATTSSGQVPPKMKMTTAIPPSITTPDTVDTRIGTLKFTDGFPDDATVQKGLAPALWLSSSSSCAEIARDQVCLALG